MLNTISVEIATFLKMLLFRIAGFKSPTDLRVGIIKWNTATQLIKMRYISKIDFNRVIFRYSRDTFAL